MNYIRDTEDSLKNMIHSSFTRLSSLSMFFMKDIGMRFWVINESSYRHRINNKYKMIMMMISSFYTLRNSLDYVVRMTNVISRISNKLIIATILIVPES